MSKVQNVPGNVSVLKYIKRVLRSFFSFVQEDTIHIFWITILQVFVYLPVLPMPALQCTTIGGPRGCPAHVSPLLASNLLCCCLTKDKNCNKAEADLGTP